jgi:two-component system chemotaxis response regulator CheY
MTKILVIDDDAIVRMTVEHILRDAGYEVLTAENGLRGMAVFCSQQPDLVITDILMPEQEGIQTIAEMRKAKPDAKIIAISGGGHGGKVDFLSMARALGAMDCRSQTIRSGPTPGHRGKLPRGPRTPRQLGPRSLALSLRRDPAGIPRSFPRGRRQGRRVAPSKSRKRSVRPAPCSVRRRSAARADGAQNLAPGRAIT